jgi:hypothetical protein
MHMFRDRGWVGHRIVAQEADNRREATQRRARFVDLPVVDRRFVDADHLRDILLEEAEIEAALPDMITYCFQ